MKEAEYIFLLDCNGSMRGTPINLAANSLTYFIKSLSTNSYFNVIQFGSDMKPFFNDSVPVNDENTTTAINKISEVEQTF